MKKILLFSIAIQLMYCSLVCNAQYVAIPDSQFVKWLTANIPSAMNGNQMDTTNPAVTSLTRIKVENDSINDITGVQYFTSLITLDCGNGLYAYALNRIKILPPLPATLDTLICGRNMLDSLPTLPSNLRFLKCYENPLHQLPPLPNTITYLECYSDLLTKIDSLPSSLYYLNCSFNLLDSLPTLPNTLQTLYCNSDSLTVLPLLPNSLLQLNCGNNYLTNLPALPSALLWLECESNQLTNLPVLPSSLGYLDCNNNLLTNLPVLSPALYWLNCWQNQLTVLPALPGSLDWLYCGQNQITVLPTLPNSLRTLNCSSNFLTTLPALNSLQYLYCINNQLTGLPSLPNSLNQLYCGQNQLTGLPTLSNSLQELYCENNNISCFPVFPESIFWLSIYNNPFNCIQNYIQHMDSITLTFPLCLSGNSNGCAPAQGLVGFAYGDNNGNCIKDFGDGKLINIPVELYDNANNFLAKTFTAINGVYDFPQPAGTYTVLIDTLGMPFAPTCTFPGVDSVVTTTLLDTNINFALACKPGFDIGVQSLTTGSGLIFPGLNHTLFTSAGDMSRWYNFNCAAGTSGQVEITVTGNVNYVGPAAGALTPVVSGNVYTYNIADFGLVNNANDFNLLFQTMTTAQAGDIICASVSVTPTAGDYNQLNNSFTYCYVVSNSHDPNAKEVYPQNVPSGYQDWFTYTIHFQNTGNGTAMNIRIADTLDAHLDWVTFQEINYSHNNTALLVGNILTINFPNINLPDSGTNSAGSNGFVQYRVKPKSNVQIGSQIKNTASIYFDYNDPIVTNTAVSTYLDVIPTAVNEIKTNELFIFPNPASDFLNINYPSKNSHVQFAVIDLMGRQIKSGQILSQINITNLQTGFYILKIMDGENSFTKRFIKN